MAAASEEFLSGSESSECDDCDDSDAPSQPLPEPHATVNVDQEFDTFEQLHSVVSRCCRCKLSHNPRKEAKAVARQWVKDLLPLLDVYHTSGTLYCFQSFTETNKLKHARTSCPFQVAYVFTRDQKWKVTKAALDHNHVLQAPVISLSGLRHICQPADLTVDECTAVLHWLESKMVTAQVRYHFRSKFPGSEISRRCVRSMREQLSKNVDPHAIDRLVELVEKYAREGGIGKIHHEHFRIKSIIMQHPLMRKIAQMFGVVTTIDGTHKTSKYEQSTLLNCVCMDSFGKLACCGVMFNESESESSITELLDECGILAILKTLISDESKASLAFILNHPQIAHILCRWHWLKHFNTSMDNVSINDKEAVTKRVMKVLKWRGYSSDDALLEDIRAIQRTYRSLNSKLASELKSLETLRVKLCSFHTLQSVCLGKSTSQLSEVFNSSIKGGNELSRILRANNYHQTLTHISQLVSLYIDETCIRIRSCVEKKEEVSEWVASKLRSSIRSVMTCMSPLPEMISTNADGSENWKVFEKVAAKDELPGFTQEHNVIFSSNASACCSCPTYVSGLMLCSGCAAVCALKGHTELKSLIPYLHSMWLVRNHPMYLWVYPPDHDLGLSAPSVSNANGQGNSQLSIVSQCGAPTTAAERGAILRTVFDDIMSRVKDATSFHAFHTVLLQHRSMLYHAKSLLIPPPVDISKQQEQSGLGHVGEVQNQANYNRGAKNRKDKAQLIDPTAYTLFKKAAHNAPVVCECGETVVNDHRIVYLHRKKKRHQDWLAEYRRRNINVDPAADNGQDGASAVFSVYPICLCVCCRRCRGTRRGRRWW
jgi:hypothetical protein